MLQCNTVPAIPKFGPLYIRVVYRQRDGQTQTVSHGTRPEGRDGPTVTLSGRYFNLGIIEIHHSYGRHQTMSTSA